MTTPKHINQFPPGAFSGFTIIQVDDGTVIDGPDGEKITVTDDAIALRGLECFVTPKVYVALKERTTL